MHAFQKSDQMITCRIELLNHNKFVMCSVVYAKNAKEERKQLWSELDQTKCNLPWIVLGDFD